jgi:hypothetical protein
LEQGNIYLFKELEQQAKAVPVLGKRKEVENSDCMNNEVMLVQSEF